MQKSVTKTIILPCGATLTVSTNGIYGLNVYAKSGKGEPLGADVYDRDGVRNLNLYITKDSFAAILKLANAIAPRKKTTKKKRKNA